MTFTLFIGALAIAVVSFAAGWKGGVATTLDRILHTQAEWDNLLSGFKAPVEHADFETVSRVAEGHQ